MTPGIYEKNFFFFNLNYTPRVKMVSFENKKI